MPCRTPSCSRSIYARGYCTLCYAAVRSGERPTAPCTPPPKCEVCQERLAVGPFEMICALCYADLSSRILLAPTYRSPDPARVGGWHRVFAPAVNQ